METITYTLEAEFSGVGAGWTDITADVLIARNIVFETGIKSISPADLLANPGSLKFSLDNDITNSGAKKGYYTLGHANCRSGFGRGIRVRFSILYGATRYYKAINWITQISPAPGTWGERATQITAMDWLHHANETPARTLAIQNNKRIDELVTTLLTSLTIQPPATDFEAGISILEQAFDREEGGKDSVYTVLGRLCRSEFGRVYLRGGTSGVSLRVEDRQTRMTTAASAGTLDNVTTSLEVEDGISEVYDLVNGRVIPRRIDSSYIVLFTLQERMPLLPVDITPGGYGYFVYQFRDPSTGEPISAIDVQAPAHTTDWLFGSVADGVTDDLNTYYSVSLSTVGGNSVYGYHSNSYKTEGYLNKFQIRGKGVYIYDQIDIIAGVDTYGDRTLDFDTAYQGNLLTAKDIIDYLYSKVSDRTAKRIRRCGFHANRSAAQMAAALTGEISTRWTIIEAQTGISGDWFVNAVRYMLGPGGRLDVEWTVVPAADEVFWVLGNSTLGVDTYLGV